MAIQLMEALLAFRGLEACIELQLSVEQAKKRLKEVESSTTERLEKVGAESAELVEQYKLENAEGWEKSCPWKTAQTCNSTIVGAALREFFFVAYPISDSILNKETLW